MTKRKNKTYTTEFKQEAVALVTELSKVTQFQRPQPL